MSDERLDRQLLLSTIAEDGISRGFFSKPEVLYYSEYMKFVVDGYFILSDRYKALRIKEGHLTSDTKVAAMTALSILTFVPFRPASPSNVVSDSAYFCCEYFALAVASFMANFRIPQGTPSNNNYQYRILEQLQYYRMYFRALDRYRIDVSNGQRKNIDIYLDPLTEHDLFHINCLINLFEGLSGEFEINK